MRVVLACMREQTSLAVLSVSSCMVTGVYQSPSQPAHNCVVDAEGRVNVIASPCSVVDSIMESPESKRTPPKAWTPNYLKGTSSHQSRVTAPSAKAKENIDAVDLFTRHDDKRPGRFSVPNGATTPPRSRAPTPPPATSHFAVSTKPIEELEPLDDSWGVYTRCCSPICAWVSSLTATVFTMRARCGSVTLVF